MSGPLMIIGKSLRVLITPSNIFKHQSRARVQDFGSKRAVRKQWHCPKTRLPTRERHSPHWQCSSQGPAHRNEFHHKFTALQHTSLPHQHICASAVAVYQEAGSSSGGSTSSSMVRCRSCLSPISRTTSPSSSPVMASRSSSRRRQCSHTALLHGHALIAR